MRTSITGKMCFILLIIFSTVLISTTFYQAYRERQLISELGQAHVQTLAQNYQNALDLFVTNEHPENFREFEDKLLQNREIFSLKLITQKTELFSAATGHLSAPTSTDEKLALRGQSALNVVEHDGHTWVELLQPYFLPGQNMNNPPVAAIGMEYSLDKQLDMVEKHIMLSAIMLSAIFCGVLLMTLSITRKHIVQPLQQLRRAVDDVTDFNNLSTRLPVTSNDEIAQLNDSFNQLMERLAAKAAESRPSVQEPPVSREE